MGEIVEVVNWESGEWHLVLSGTRLADNAFCADGVKLQDSARNVVLLHASLPKNVIFPDWAITPVTATSIGRLDPNLVAAKIRNASDDKELSLKATLLDALRRIETIEVEWAAEAFLKLPTPLGAHATLQGEAKLFLSKWLLKDAASTSGNFKIAEFLMRADLSINAPGDPRKAAYALACVIRLDADLKPILPALRFDLDDFNLSLPEFKLTLPQLNLRNPLPPLPFPVEMDAWAAGMFERFAPSVGKLTVTPATGETPQLCIRLDAAKGLQWAVVKQPPQLTDWDNATSMEPNLASFNASWNGQAYFNNLKAASLGNVVILNGIFHPPTYQDNTRRVSCLGPFEISNEGLSITAEAGDSALLARVQFDRLTIRLLDDPDTSISLKGVISLTPSAVALSELELLQPYPVTLINNTASALQRGAQAIIAVVANLKIPAANTSDLSQLKHLFEILGKFAAAMARATLFVGNAVADVAQQVGQAVGNALVAVADGLQKILQKIAQMVPDIDVPAAADCFHFELRLALAPLELRQILITRSNSVSSEEVTLSGAGLACHIADGWQPGLLLDFVDQPGVYLLANRKFGDEEESEFASLSIDLWLEKAKPEGSAKEVASMRDASGHTGEQATERLIRLRASFTPTEEEDVVLVLAGLARGKPVFLQRLRAKLKALPLPTGAPAGTPALKILDGRFIMDDLTNGLKVTPEFKTDRLLPLLGMGETGKAHTAAADENQTPGDGSFFDELQKSLGQMVWVERTESPSYDASTKTVKAALVLGIKVAGIQTSVRLMLEVELATLHTKLTGGDHLIIKSKRIEQKALGLNWVIEAKDGVKYDNANEVEMFLLDFVDGETMLSLNQDKVHMQLHFNELSSDGKGVVFEVSKFGVGRRGIDLVADVSKNPVRLNGLDVPFQFTAGSLNIAASRLVQAKISGSGTLPPDLIGEADCKISLTFAQDSSGDSSDIVLQAGEAEIEKKGEPIVCHSTRFTLTLTQLGLDFHHEKGYHFYFLVTGSIRFTPKAGEFESGLLGFLKDIEIELDHTPLTGDASLLAKHVSFQKALNPRKTFPLFNLFTFELRGFGFHPSCTKFDGAPAINLSGQIQFAEIGDVAQPKIEFHALWIAAPKPGEALPRICCEGLGVELQLPGSVKMRGSVTAVDPDTRTVEGAAFAPEEYKTYGFLGQGELDIPGWGSLQANMGFLEVEHKDKPGEKRKAFFLYLQQDKLAIEIPTPYGKPMYMREAGFGFGFRYTLAGIKEAEKAKTPAQLIATLDEVSKRQGDLARFSAWSPDIDGDKFTLAMRAALQSDFAMKNYVEKDEEKMQNLFFFDLIVALRSDLTLLASMRGYLGVNYADFRKNKDNFRENPGLRGYLYVSVPRSELLARLVGNSKGFIGEHFEAIKTGSLLRKAVQSIDWSATLYIRPGLFQYELGWPDQLVVRLIEEPNMNVSLRGGMIFRAADDGMLLGYNVQADAWMRFGGSAGGSVGVALEASLQARLVARLIAYLNWQVQGSLVYGLVSLDASISFSVRAWMKVDLRFTSFTIRISYSFSLHLSAAVELAVQADKVGARVVAQVAISVFGCTLGVSVGFSFNDGLVDEARSRVERFLQMSLTNEQPDMPPLIGTGTGDQRVDREAAHAAAAQSGKQPAKQPDITPSKEKPTLPPDRKLTHLGRAIPKTDFLLVLHQAFAAPKDFAVQNGAWALLLPQESASGGFYCSPFAHNLNGAAPWERQANVHTLQISELNGLTDIRIIYRDSTTLLVSPETNTTMTWTNTIPVEGDGNVMFTLAELFDECFLTDTYWKEDGAIQRRIATGFKEPNGGRSHEFDNTPTAGKSQEQLDTMRDQAQRAHASHVASDPETERVHQVRSTVLTMFINQFVNLASNGYTSDLDAYAHVLDTGLVLYGPVDQLERLAELLTVRKADFPGELGKVKLLNESSLWFVKQDPLLLNDAFVLSANGIHLDWTLSRPWTETVAEAEADTFEPEHFLQYYEIVRTLEGQENTPRHFKIKRANTIDVRDKVDPITRIPRKQHYLIPANYQFTDDLADLDVNIRRALLPASGDADGLAAAMAWNDVFQGDEEVTLTYSVTPIDIAGTRGLPKSFVVDIRRPKPPIRAAEAELRIVQTLNNSTLDQAWQAKDDVPNDIEVVLALRDPAWEKDDNKQRRRYSLILEPEQIFPAGHYANDGMTDRVRGIGSAGAQALGNEWRFDFYFDKVKPSPGSDVDNKEIEPDEETRRRYQYWKLLLAKAEPGREPIFDKDEDEGDGKRMLQALWADGKSRVALRAWLETHIDFLENGKVVHTIPSKLTPVALEITMHRESAGKVLQSSSLRPDVFEWPVHLCMPPLLPGQVRVSTGFLHLRAPAYDKDLGRQATLTDWLDATGSANFNAVMPLRDPERRTLSIVDFDAKPNWDESVVNPLHGNSIAGYDLHEIDLDALAPMDTTALPLEQDLRAWSRARRVARIELLAPQTASLLPASNADWLGWQAHYPSQTRRIVSGRNANAEDGAKPVLGAWYSARESTPLFAVRRPRLRLLPLVPENVIDELMKKGLPDAIKVNFSATNDTNAYKTFDGKFPDAAFALDAPAFEAPDNAGHEPIDLKKIFSPSLEGFRKANGKKFGAADIRYLLLCLAWHFENPSKFAILAISLSEPEKLALANHMKEALGKWQEDPTALDGLTLTLTATQTTPVSGETGRCIIPLDFTSRLHPMLEEVVAELTLARQEGDAAAVPAVYRKYSVMQQPVQPLAAKDLANYLATTAEATDPYGWGVLQGLGLATSLRIFDAASDGFVSPHQLASMVNRVFGVVFQRWVNAYGHDDLGDPFAEILLKPGADCLLRPFDAPVKQNLGVAKQEPVDDIGLSLIQISLRPAALAVWQYQLLDCKFKLDPISGIPSDGVLRTDSGVKTTTWHSHTLQAVNLIISIRTGFEAELNAQDKQIEVLDARSGASVVFDGSTGKEVRLPLRTFSTADIGKDVSIALLLRSRQSNADGHLTFRVECLVDTTITTRTVVIAADGSRSETSSITVMQKQSSGTLTIEPKPAVLEPGSTQHDPYELFKPCTAQDWGSAFAERKYIKIEDGIHIHSKYNQGFAAFRSLRQQLRAAAPTLQFPAENAYSTVAAAYLLWAQRMLEHGAARRTVAAGENARWPIGLAFAALAKTTPWRLAQDALGRIRLGIPAQDRWAHTRAYAVKPISRYQNLMLSVGVIAQRDAEALVTPDMIDIASKDNPKLNTPIGYALAVTQRTERMAAPLIVATDIQRDNNWELVLGRHGEETLAASNRTMLGRLGKPEVLLAQQRAYRTPGWPTALRNTFCSGQILPKPWPAEQQLPSRIGQLPTRPEKGSEVALMDANALRDHARQSPSLWKGAEVYGFLPLPPHYRMLALAVARAGVVVSDISAVVQDDLPRKPLRGQEEVLKTGGECKPQLELVASGNESTRYRLRHRMVSHADLTPDFAKGWFEHNQKNEDVAWWPDPDVVYTLSHKWQQADGGVVVDEDAEIRLLAHANGGETEPVIVRTRGVRWQVAADASAIQTINIRREMSSATDLPEFVLETHMLAREENNPPMVLSLTDAEKGTDLEMLKKFDHAIHRIGLLLAPHTLKFDFDMAAGETEAQYLERMKTISATFNTSRQTLLSDYAKKFDVAALQNDYRLVCDAIGKWFQRDDGRAGIKQRFDKWLAEPAQDGIRSYGKGDITGKITRMWPMWPLAATLPELQIGDPIADTVVLRMWDVPADTDVPVIKACGLPLVQPNSRFWQLLKQRITADGDLVLRAVDSRAAYSQDTGAAIRVADGVVSTEVAWPAWIV